MYPLFRSLLFEISVTDIMGDGILDERYVFQLFLEYRAANFPAMAGDETPTTWDKLPLTIIMDEVQGNLHRPTKKFGDRWCRVELVSEASSFTLQMGCFSVAPKPKVYCACPSNEPKNVSDIWERIWKLFLTATNLVFQYFCQQIRWILNLLRLGQNGTFFQ